MQRDWWTPPGTTEVTCNLFSLKATEMMLGVTPRNAPWLIGQKSSATTYLKSPSFRVWKNTPGIALFIYAQIIEDFGWNALKAVLKSYETGDSNTYPSNEQGQIDLFWSKMSIQVGQNLAPLLTKWGIPYSSGFTSKVKDLPAYSQKVNLFA